MSPPRNFTILENNPESLNHLAHKLGLSKSLSFYDIYSLHDQDLLAHIPRPVHALLTIIPLTPAWSQDRTNEDTPLPKTYTESGQPDEKVLWFKQTMHNGCGSVGLIHCIANSLARDSVIPGSPLDQILTDAVALSMDDRAELLNSSDPLFEAHQEAAELGDTQAPRLGIGEHAGQHFVAFVKDRKDGRLWELEGDRRGPIDRGSLGHDEDALSPRAVALGIGRVIELESRANGGGNGGSGGGDLRFSCVALAPSNMESS